MSSSSDASDALAPDPSAIGGVSVAPFAVAPEPERLFAQRAARFRLVAEGNALAPYLLFLGDLSDAQHRCQEGLPAPAMPDAEAVERARAFEMPPLDKTGVAGDPVLADTFSRLLALAESIAMPDAAAQSLARLKGTDETERAQVLEASLGGAAPMGDLGTHLFASAALQVHFARLAARLDPARLVSVGDGLCPACGSLPVSSIVVNWPTAHGARYCVCHLCATWWNFVRVRCTSCGTTKGIGYQEVEGSEGTIKAETCEDCRTYLKVFYLPKDSGLDPVADDVRSLGLDLLMKEGPYRRAGLNPFLMGY